MKLTSSSKNRIKKLILFSLLALGLFPIFAPSQTTRIINNAIVAITGGTINGTPIGATTQSTGAFSTLAAGGTTLNAAPAAGFQYNGSAGNFFVRTNGAEAYFTIASDFYFGGIGAGSKMHLYAGNSDSMDFWSTGMVNPVSNSLVIGNALPSYASGGCSTHGSVTGSGTSYFSIQMTGTCTGSQPIVFTLPAATNGWMCTARDATTQAHVLQTGAVSTTSVTITDFGITTGTAQAWTTNDVVVVSCMGG